MIVSFIIHYLGWQAERGFGALARNGDYVNLTGNGPNSGWRCGIRRLGYWRLLHARDNVIIIGWMARSLVPARF
jgi:hypothetical protein